MRRLEERTWEVRAVRVEGKLRIDGKLDDPAWARAQPVTEFYQRETNEGLSATEPTHVFVLFDETNLYWGFRCFDSDPNRPRARTMFRDENIAADDAVSVMIDAYKKTMTRKNQTTLPPVLPGEILREDLMKPLQISINRLARDLRVPVTRISKIVNGRRGVSADTAFGDFGGRSSGAARVVGSRRERHAVR